MHDRINNKIKGYKLTRVNNKRNIPNPNIYDNQIHIFYYIFNPPPPPPHPGPPSHSTVSPLSPVLTRPLYILRHYLHSNSEADSQSTNYECGIPFPVPGSFPPPPRPMPPPPRPMPYWLLICLMLVRTIL